MSSLHRIRLCLGTGVISVWLVLPQAKAEWLPMTGHFKGLYQYQSWPMQQAERQAEHTYLTAADVRLKSGYAQNQWRFDVAYQVNAEAGSTMSLQQRLTPWKNPDDTHVFNLSSEWLDEENIHGWQRLDRFNLSYTHENAALKIGRQALSWGRGNLFNPMDLFNPFSPYAIDTEYKPGTDMVNGQWLSSAGNDLTAVVIPRRNEETGELEASQSSSALKWHQLSEAVEWQAMAAKDYEDWVAALSISGNIEEASWNMDWVPTYLTATSQLKHSVVVNVNYAWQWGTHNVTGFVEYYYNGLGEDKANPRLDQLNTALTVRQQRHQIFAINQHYFDAGLTFEWTPLLSVMPSVIHNLQDASGLLQINGRYSLSDDHELLGGLQLPYGARGSEYGGLYLTGELRQVLARPAMIYAQWNLYF